MENTKRNGTIDFFKFVGAVLIAGYHAGWLGLNGSGSHANSPFLRGYMAVEFYFIVSGYLLAAKAANYSGSVFDANLKMIRKKFLGIFAYLYPAVLAGHVISTMVSYSPRTLSHHLLFSTSELLHLQMLGFPTFTVARSTWYLSALMFASFLIYPLLCKYREACVKYVAPVCSLFFYGLVLQTEGFLGTLYEWHSVVYTGMLRGIAGIFWGGVAYELKLYFDRQKDEDKLLLGAFEVFGYAFFVSYGVFSKESGKRDFLLLLPLMLAVAVSFSNKSVLCAFFRHPVFGVFPIQRIFQKQKTQNPQLSNFKNSIYGRFQPAFRINSQN